MVETTELESNLNKMNLDETTLAVIEKAENFEISEKSDEYRVKDASYYGGFQLLDQVV